MDELDIWLKAEHELEYRIKQETHKLRKKLFTFLNWDVSKCRALAEQKLKQDIELRAYLIDRATKDYMMNDWLQAKWECHQMPDFDSKVNELAQKLVQDVQVGGGCLDPEFARKAAERLFIRTAAYYIWEIRCKMEDDWYSSEKSLSKEIKNLALATMRKEPYLSEEEAWYCAIDKLHFNVREKAYYRRKWIAERAYYSSLSYPNKEYENWCQAAQEYD